jgi:hypothetical protein
MAKREQEKPIRRASAVEANKIAEGGKRLPGGVMSAQAAQDMEHLLSVEYAPSQLQVIERSLREARAANPRKRKRKPE